MAQSSFIRHQPNANAVRRQTGVLYVKHYASIGTKSTTQLGAEKQSKHGQLIISVIHLWHMTTQSSKPFSY